LRSGVSKLWLYYLYCDAVEWTGGYDEGDQWTSPGEVGTVVVVVVVRRRQTAYAKLSRLFLSKPVSNTSSLS